MFKLYSSNGQIIVEKDSSIIYLVNSNLASLEVLNNQVILSDSFNRPNSYGQLRLNMGAVNNIISDASVIFTSNGDLLNYFYSLR